MKRKHSELGIASFSISIVISIFMILIQAIYFILPIQINPFTPETIALNKNAEWVWFFLFFCYPIVFLVALGLGIGGLIQKERKKLFAILGIIISAMTITYPCCITLYAIGTQSS